MTDVKISSRAYTKIILHAAKYPYAAVNGLLLAAKDKSKNQFIVDAIPLFHQCLNVTPMAEIALVQVEAMAADEGLLIAGYYAAAENFNDSSIEKIPGARIPEKIAEHFSNAVCVMVDNKAMSLNMERPAIKAWQNADSRWVKTNFSVDSCDSTLEAVSALLQKGAMKDINDFDNYLDNVENDWLNEHLNRDLKQLLAMY
ncbi:ER membrane protein complex subunit 8/9 like [Pseudolycoriella hygida]|uniref:ER membrane protein complex subunit 8/9 like n=1 Tax=Pseudolycoriella hygida TaxID=35572 RepID=A0A9Q0S7N8_9DIPT|nr:ER membrane protein complex subunit 8/9 like [Pseudolycoriella hygida]